MTGNWGLFGWASRGTVEWYFSCTVERTAKLQWSLRVQFWYSSIIDCLFWGGSSWRACWFVRMLTYKFIAFFMSWVLMRSKQVTRSRSSWTPVRGSVFMMMRLKRAERLRGCSVRVCRKEKRDQGKPKGIEDQKNLSMKEKVPSSLQISHCIVFITLYCFLHIILFLQLFRQLG